MSSAVDQYLKTLLAFVPKNKANRFTKDYIALVHVPAFGSEKVYSLVLDEENPMLTIADYESPLWEFVDSDGEFGDKPGVDALQVEVAKDHPVFEYLGTETLKSCQNFSESQPGLDYYLMLWQKNGEAGVVECYEPYARGVHAWTRLIGAMQVLASQFEYALK